MLDGKALKQVCHYLCNTKSWGILYLSLRFHLIGFEKTRLYLRSLRSSVIGLSAFSKTWHVNSNIAMIYDDIFQLVTPVATDSMVDIALGPCRPKHLCIDLLPHLTGKCIFDKIASPRHVWSDVEVFGCIGMVPYWDAGDLKLITNDSFRKILHRLAQLDSYFV